MTKEVEKLKKKIEVADLKKKVLLSELVILRANISKQKRFDDKKRINELREQLLDSKS